MKKIRSFIQEKFLNQGLAKKIDKARKLAGIILVSSLLLQLSLGVVGINAVSTNPPGANGPSLDGSLAVANVTKGDTTYKDSVDALVDDVVKFEMAYHNTQPSDSGIIGHNVTVRILLPKDVNTNLIATGSVAGSDTNTVTDIAAVKTQIPANLEYVSGSAKWRHNIGTVENQNWVTENISDNVVTTGVNIGDVKPCWEFQGTVTILGRLKASSLKVEKKVGVPGGGSWVKENTAKPGDKLSYLISYTNTGNTDLTNMLVGDNLPPYMTYVAGSTTMITGTYPNGTSVPDGVTSGGIKVGTYKPGAGGHIKFQVTINKDIPVGTHVLKNIGLAKADQTPEVWDSTKTTVVVKSPEPECKPNFVLSKSAYNETKEKDATTVLANAGDTVKYTLTTKNTGNSCGDITIKDNVSDILEYATITELGGGNLSSNEINYGVTKIDAGQTVTKNFKVKIKPFGGWPKSGDETLTNIYGNQIVVKLGFFTIGKNKTAFNNTKSVDAITKKASAGDTITYTLVTANTGNDKANDIIVSDDIKDVLEYATVTDMKGGIITNGVISWPAIDINAGTTVKNEFVIKVKKPLPENKQDGKSYDLTMENIYGNDVVVEIEKPLLPPAPIPQVLGAQVESLVKTGANSLLMIVLTIFMFVSSLFLYFREKVLLSGALRRA